MNCGVVDQNVITRSCTHAGHSTNALARPVGYLMTPARRRQLLQSEPIGVRSGKRLLGLAAYKTAGTCNRVARHFLGDRSLDPPGTQLVLARLTMALEIAALRDEHRFADAGGVGSRTSHTIGWARIRQDAPEQS
jgi:hypothetical protein